MDEGGVSGRVRGFVWTFLGVFVVCGVAGLNLWPFTGWRLFSQVRTDQVSGWEVTTVDAGGDERAIPFADLPAGYRTFAHVAAGLDRLPDDERLGVCRAWAAAGGGGRQVVEVRVYAFDASLRDPGAFRKELRYSCTP